MQQKKISAVLFIVLTFSLNGFAGESLFGIANRSIGLVQHSFASSGKARSYEVAHTDSLQLNYRNFAAWTDIAYTFFTIKAGYAGALSEGAGSSEYNDYANFRGGLLAFPIYKQRMVMGIGVLPYTLIDQRLQQQYTIAEEDLDVFQSLIIRGGLSRALLNIAFSPISGYRFALGYEYTFGQVEENLVKELRDNTTSTLIIDYDYRYAGNGVVLSALGQPMEKLTVGAVIRPPVTLRTKREAESASLLINKQIKGKIRLPAEFSFGLEYHLSPKYITGLEFMYQDFKNGFEQNGSRTANSELLYRVGAGIERKPSERLFVNLTERMAYRLGGFYGQLNYGKASEPVTEYGLSLGFSLPIQRFQSGIDLSALVGKRGSKAKNGLEEIFVAFDITINASEIWFKNRED